MEEDRSPVYFLGATSVIMFFAFLLPLTYRLVSATFGALSALTSFLYQKATGAKSASDPKKKSKVESYSAAIRAHYEETASKLRKVPGIVHDRVQLYWQHPSLFFWNDFPNAVNSVLQPKNILVAMWLLSLYFFMIQVPQARFLEVLELDPHDPSITPADIKSAYKRLSFKYHPDSGSSAETREKYEQVRKAYKRLKAVQRAEETGEEDFFEDDGERGVSIPIPLFLQNYSSEHPGRTVFFMLFIAFGLPAYILYRMVFRSRTQQTSSRGPSIRSYADYQRYMAQIHTYKVQIDRLFEGLGSLAEVPVSGEALEQPPAEPVSEKTPLESPANDPFQVIEDFEQENRGMHRTPEEPALPAVREEASSRDGPELKLVFQATSPSYLKTTFTYIDIVISTVIEQIAPIDIQRKFLRLCVLYSDKKAIIQKMNEAVWAAGDKQLDVVAPALSKIDEKQASKAESASCPTLRFLHRTQNRYKIEKVTSPLEAEISSISSKAEKSEAGASPDSPQGGSCDSAAEETTGPAAAQKQAPFISMRQLEKLSKIDEEIAQVFADIEKSSFEYLSSRHTRGRKREQKSKKMKKEKQEARS